MKFIVSWTQQPSAYSAAIARFLEAGGLPPKGVEMIGRWHGMSGHGFAVVSTKDPKALYAWVSEWADVLQIETTPCLEDTDAGKVLKSMKR